jgi:hypothetical protein
MMPIPPIQCVVFRQKSNPEGKASMSDKIVEPVVVKPETLSNQAFTNVNSPPQRRYGKIPIRQDRSQPATTITSPSFPEIAGLGGTKNRGNTPKRAHITEL